MKIEDVDFEDLIKKLNPDSQKIYKVANLVAIISTIKLDHYPSDVWKITAVLKDLGYSYLGYSGTSVSPPYIRNK